METKQVTVDGEPVTLYFSRQLNAWFSNRREIAEVRQRKQEIFGRRRGSKKRTPWKTWVRTTKKPSDD